MDLVAAAQLIFLVVCTDASLLSNCSAHVTEMLLCCSAFASFYQKSPVASSHFNSSISSISSAKQMHKYSLEIIIDLPLGFPINNIFSISTRLKCGLTLPAGF